MELTHHMLVSFSLQALPLAKILRRQIPLLVALWNVADQLIQVVYFLSLLSGVSSTCDLYPNLFMQVTMVGLVLALNSCQI